MRFFTEQSSVGLDFFFKKKKKKKAEIHKFPFYAVFIWGYCSVRCACHYMAVASKQKAINDPNGFSLGTLRNNHTLLKFSRMRFFLVVQKAGFIASRNV